jgi:hypothetical protein
VASLERTLKTLMLLLCATRRGVAAVSAPSCASLVVVELFAQHRELALERLDHGPADAWIDVGTRFPSARGRDRLPNFSASILVRRCSSSTSARGFGNRC